MPNMTTIITAIKDSKEVQYTGNIQGYCVIGATVVLGAYSSLPVVLLGNDIKVSLKYSDLNSVTIDGLIAIGETVGDLAYKHGINDWDM